MPSTILSDNGVSSGTAGVKTTGSNDGILELQTTTAGGTATTAVSINTTQQVAVTAGTAAAPSIIPSGDTNTGIFFPAADTIAFTEGGAESMRINSSGNVGIGTTSPGASLDIAKDNETQIIINRTTTTTGAAFIKFINGGGNYYVGPDSSTGNRGFATGGAAYGLVINVESAYPICFGTNNTERMRIDSSGNLGLGVTPSAWSAFKAFDLFSTSGASLASTGGSMQLGMNFYYNGTNYIYKSTGHATRYEQLGGGAGTTYHAWHTAPSGTAGNAITFTQAMTLDANGNLLVGITSGSFKFMVGDGTRDMCINPNSALDGIFVGTIQSKPLIFGTANTERARITSDGNLFINTTSALVAGRKLQVVKDGGGPVIFKVENGVGNEVLLVWNNATSGNNLFQEFATEGSITIRGSIDYDRSLGQVRYNVMSDATLKNIIGDADGQKSLEILNSTRIREYAWKDDPTQKPQIGVIAQELYETFKGAVSVGGEVEETDDDGNVTTRYRPWGVDKTGFTFHLVAGWQAHEKIIKQQADMIAALEARLTALENK